jgi:hypothetical protein
MASVTKSQRVGLEVVTAGAIFATAALRLLVYPPPPASSLGGLSHEQRVIGVIGAGGILLLVFVRWVFVRRAEKRLQRESSIAGTGGDADALARLGIRYQRLGNTLRVQAQKIRLRDERAVSLASADECETRANALNAVLKTAKSGDRGRYLDTTAALAHLLSTYPERFRERLESHGAAKHAIRELLAMLENRSHPHWADLEVARRMEIDAIDALEEWEAQRRGASRAA